MAAVSMWPPRSVAEIDMPKNTKFFQEGAIANLRANKNKRGRIMTVAVGESAELRTIKYPENIKEIAEIRELAGLQLNSRRKKYIVNPAINNFKIGMKFTAKLWGKI